MKAIFDTRRLHIDLPGDVVIEHLEGQQCSHITSPMSFEVVRRLRPSGFVHTVRARVQSGKRSIIIGDGAHGLTFTQGDNSPVYISGYTRQAEPTVVRVTVGVRLSVRGAWQLAESAVKAGIRVH